VRGVINTGASDPSKESREHALWTEDGLITVTGGKLTTFRVMAMDTLRSAKKQLPAVKTMRRSRILDDVSEPIGEDLDPKVQVRLLGRHGASAATVLGMPEGTERFEDTEVLWSELRFAARDEGVVRLEDLLLRRARVGLLGKNGGLDAVARIRSIVQAELGWDDATWAKEEAAYRQTWTAHYSPSPSSPSKGKSG
jgi:glycerol-3-phosphate dehydrogenase